MKIGKIDKEFEDIIYYLDKNGFKPFSSCDGVETSHDNPKDVNMAYIGFLKSTRIIDLMARFLKDKENFSVSIQSENYSEPQLYYENVISGNNYAVSFYNRFNERTTYFENIIKTLVEEKGSEPSEEKRNLYILDKVLEENSDSDLTFCVTFNGEYQPYMSKSGRINSLTITTKSAKDRIEGNIEISTMRDMMALSEILSKKYHLDNKLITPEEKYSENEFISADKCSCSIYFTDEHFPQILEQIEYIKEISHTLPTFESKEWIGSDEELLELYNEENIEQYTTKLPDEYIKNFTKWAEGNKYLFELFCSCRKNGIKTFASCGGHEMSEFEPSEIRTNCSAPYVGIILDANSFPYMKDIIFQLKDMQNIQIRADMLHDGNKGISFHAINTNCCEMFYKINSVIENRKEEIKSNPPKGNILERFYRDIKSRILYRGVKKVFSTSEEKLKRSNYGVCFSTITEDFLQYEKNKYFFLVEGEDIPGFEELNKKYGYLQREYYPPMEQAPVALLEETKQSAHNKFVEERKAILTEQKTSPQCKPAKTKFDKERS